jgi:hypothetical protein
MPLPLFLVKGVSVHVKQTFSVILLLSVNVNVNTTKIVLPHLPVKITSALIPAQEDFVVSMLSVMCKITMPFAPASMATLETLSPDVILPNLSAQLIQNAQIT